MTELSANELFDPEALLALSRRTAPGGALSIYAHADSGSDPGLQGAAIDIKNRLTQLERNIKAEGPPERAQALRSEIGRRGPEIERLTSPEEHGRGRALFVLLGGEEPDIWFSSQMALTTRVVLDSGPFIHPLLELLDEGRPAGVVLASHEEARLLDWRLGEVRELERIEAAVVEATHERPGSVGSSPSNRARSPKRELRDAREQEQTRRLLERVQAAASRLGGEHGWERVLVSGGDRLTEPLAAALTGLPEDMIIRDARVLIELDEASLASIITDQLHAQHDAYESRLVQQTRDAALGSGSGALGLSEVVGALNEGRVSHLVYDPAIRYRGSVSADGRLHAGEEAVSTAIDATAELRLTERLVEQALETGARVTPVEGAAGGVLAEAEGIAALLRW